MSGSTPDDDRRPRCHRRSATSNKSPPKDLESMAETIPGRRAMALLGRVLNRLVSQWTIPGAGRVAVCSPLVGLIAGLGAVAFLRLLELMVHYVLNGLLHFHMPPTGEGVPH